MKIPNQAIKNLGLLIAIFMTIAIASCKKEFYDAEKIDKDHFKLMKTYQNGASVSIISLEKFKDNVNIQKLGVLKEAFLSPLKQGGKFMSVNIPATYNGFTLQTDSIRVVHAGDHTSYVFPVKMANSRGTTFQNLTIDEGPNGTQTFINTYTPTKKWIAEWKAGKITKFDGSIGVTYINGISNAITPNINATSFGKISSANIPGALGLAELVEDCSTTTYYYEMPYPCASGRHMPGEPNCTLTGDERAGIAQFSIAVTVCQGGGSGGTTPTPPPDYDPCDETPPPPLPTVSNIFNGATGLKLMVHEDPPCPPDDELPPLLPVVKAIKNLVKSPCLSNQVNKALNSKSTISRMLKEEFSGTEFMYDPDIYFRDSTNLADTVDGNMHRSGLDYTITLNQNKLPTTSKEYIMSTVYHEVLHAYLELYFIKNGKGQYVINPQHNAMADKYVTLISGALINDYGIPANDAWALAWGGLQETTLWDGPNAIFSKTQKDAIALVNTKYRDGTKGSYCNSSGN
jgi:hypothetical protein